MCCVQIEGREGEKRSLERKTEERNHVSIASLRDGERRL